MTAGSDFVLIPGGPFVMGSDHHYREERPAHPHSVNQLEMSATAVTNREFAAFVEATGYQTTAEIPLPNDAGPRHLRL